MRLLMLTHTYYPSVGGGIRYKKAVVDHVRSLGHTADVLAVNKARTFSVEPEQNGTVTRLPQWFEANSSQIAPGYLAAFGRMAPRYDTLLFNFPSPMCELGMVAWRRRVKSVRKVAMYHADIVPAKRFAGPYNRHVTRPFLQAMDQIVVSSPKIVDTSPHLAPFRDKVRVIPFGVDPAVFDAAAPREQDPVEGRPLRLLFVGRLSRYKGLNFLIDAMVGAPGELTIVGDGPLRTPLEEQVAALRLGDRVTFAGLVEEDALLRAYHHADVLILPSIDPGEAFGYVLIEAMMCATALVTTELGTGTSYVNQHGGTGFVVPPSDAGAIRESLVQLDADRSRLAEVKRASRARALEQFTLDRMLRETIEVLTP